MELIDILRVLMRRWWLVAIPIVIVAIFTVPDLLRDSPATSGGFSTVMRYTAGQQLEAIPDREGDFQDVWLASELTVNAFTDWVRTTSFAEEVAAVAVEGGLEIDSAELSIGADNSRSIGQIFINWHDEDELRTIAEAAVTVLRTRNQEYFPQLGDAPATVVLLDEPRITAVPPSLPNRFRPLIQLIAAGLAGIAIAFLIEYLDPTLHDRREAERLGLRIIGSIPKR